MINLNHWLSDNGYLEFTSDNRGRLDQIKSNMIKRLAKAYRTRLAASYRASIRARLGMERFSRVKEEFESSLLTSRIIWDRTRAYSLGAGGNIYLNLAGREPEGVVSPGNYDPLCQEICEKLMSWSAPDTGKPVVKRVYRREELYQGPYISDAPDLIIEWQDYAFWGRGSYDISSPIFEAQRHFDFSDQPLTGSHRLDGILICQGPEIRTGTNIENAQLIDLAPTLLTLMGIPPSPDMDGRLLTQMLTAEFAEEVKDLVAVLPSQSEQEKFEYTPEEAELIAEHLRSLGYM
jgi:predicted AlkP superfamily phosphohydrolase/phosphomutase